MTRAFFDLETTGLGKKGGIIFRSPVGIYSAGTAIGGSAPMGMYGRTDIAIEPGAKHIAELPGNAKGIANATQSEKQMLQSLVESWKTRGVTELVGYNSHSFDTPVLLKRLKSLGLHREASFVKGMQHTDLMKLAKEQMDVALRRYSDAIPWEFGDKVPRGMRLESIAKGLGYKGSAVSHVASADVEMTQFVWDMVKDPDKFAKNFSVLRWAKSVDQMEAAMERKRAQMPFELLDDTVVIPSKYLPSGGYYGPLLAAGGGRDPMGPHKPVDYDVTRAGSTFDSSIDDWNAEAEAKKAAEEARKKGKPIAATVEEAKDKLGKAKGQALDAALAGVDKVDSLMARMESVPVGKAAAIGAGILGGLWLLGKLEGEEEGIGEENYIEASALGLPEHEIRKEIMSAGSVKAFNKNIAERATFGALKAGRKVHKQVEEEMSELSEFVDSEVPLVDHQLGVKGISDLVMEMDGQHVPVEIKSVDDEKINQMTGPSMAHAAQANFYAHALGSSEGYVMYVSRDDPSKRKSFRVAYDPGSLMAQVQKFRNTAYMSAHGGGWQQPLERFFGNRSGTRDQAMRNYFRGPGYPRTPQEEYNTVNGSHYLPRN